eukprot:215608_1
MSPQRMLLHLLLLHYASIVQAITTIECQNTNCNGQTLTCNDPDGCQITCQQCQNTIILCTSDITITCAIKCLNAGNPCNFAEIYSAAQDTTLSCESDNGCANSKIYFGDVYNYLSPTIQPTQSPSKWNAPTTATFHVAAPTSYTLESVDIFCEGDIKSCTVTSSNTNAANSLEMTCNAPTANCLLNCNNPTGCNNVNLYCQNYQSCICSNNCNSVTTTYITDAPTTSIPTTVTPTTTQPTTNQPTKTPTLSPTNNPTPAPTNIPTPAPTTNPTPAPTDIPTFDPTMNPINDPTFDPSKSPTMDPTMEPTVYPTSIPTYIPTQQPSFTPTIIPSVSPIFSNTESDDSDSTHYTIIIKSNDKDFNENDVENIIKDSVDVNDIISTKNADGSITISISVSNNGNLNKDIIQKDVTNALKQEYGNDIDIDVQVTQTDNTDNKKSNQGVLDMLTADSVVFVMTIVAVILFIMVCILLMFLCKRKKHVVDMEVEGTLSNCVQMETIQTKTVQNGEGMTNMNGHKPKLIVGITSDTIDGFKKHTSEFIGDIDDDEDDDLYDKVSTPGNNSGNNEQSGNNTCTVGNIIVNDSESSDDSDQNEMLYTKTTTQK